MVGKLKQKMLVVLIMLALMILLCESVVSAEINEIVAEYTYTMGEGESRLEATDKAIIQAKRIAIEQAGTYIESFTEVKNGKLSKDDIYALAAAVMQTEILEKRPILEGTTDKMYVKIVAKVNTTNLQEKMHDRQAIEQNKELQARNAQLFKENEELKTKLAAAISIEAKRTMQEELKAIGKQLTANQWYDIGNHAKDNDGAISAYTKAIEVDSRFAKAYNNRGVMYDNKGMLDNAIADYNLALAIDPNCDAAYNNRASVYKKKGMIDNAIADYTQALSIQPRYAIIYYNRGVAYNDKGMFDNAIADFTHALTINTRFSAAYRYRGYAYYKKGLLDNAIADYDQALSIDQQDALAYYSRGLVYTKQGKNAEAIADFQSFIRYAGSLYSQYIKQAQQKIHQLGG